MKIEHIAYNVEDPAEVAKWYGTHCGLTVVRRLPGPAQAHFLADDQSTVLEIYCNPPDKVPVYGEWDPLLFHLGFASADPASDQARLIAAGATLLTDDTLPDGSQLVMLRDPWGLAVQLCHRAQPLIGADSGKG